MNRNIPRPRRGPGPVATILTVATVLAIQLAFWAGLIYLGVLIVKAAWS